MGWTLQEFDRGVKSDLVQRRGSHHNLSATMSGRPLPGSTLSGKPSGRSPPPPPADSEAGRAVAEALKGRVERAIDKAF